MRFFFQSKKFIPTTFASIDIGCDKEASFLYSFDEEQLE